MAEESEKKKTRRPQAIKRDIQNEKSRLRNKAFKAQVRTAIRSFEEALTTKDQGLIKKEINKVYSLMDTGAKKGIFKANKANRTKSRFAARLASIS